MKIFFPARSFAFLFLLLAWGAMLQPLGAEAQRPIKVGILDTYTGPPGGLRPGCLERIQAGPERDQQERRSGKQDRIHQPGRQVQGGHRPQHGQRAGHEREGGYPGGDDQQRRFPRGFGLCQGRKDPFHRLDFQDGKNHRGEGPPLRLFDRRKYLHGRESRRPGPFQETLYEILDRRG